MKTQTHKLFAWRYPWGNPGQLRVEELPDALAKWVDEHPNTKIVHIDKRAEPVGENWTIVYTE